jgi:hypothetical protein
MSRNRTFAFVTLAVALACGSLLIAGNDWQQRVGWALWPLLIVIPVTAGRLQQQQRRKS